MLCSVIGTNYSPTRVGELISVIGTKIPKPEHESYPSSKQRISLDQCHSVKKEDLFTAYLCLGSQHRRYQPIYKADISLSLYKVASWGANIIAGVL
jgi:hypothetical protein